MVRRALYDLARVEAYPDRLLLALLNDPLHRAVAGTVGVVQDRVSDPDILDRHQSSGGDHRLVLLDARHTLVRQNEGTGLQRPPPLAEVVLHRRGGVVNDEAVGEERVRVVDREVVHERRKVRLKSS